MPNAPADYGLIGNASKSPSNRGLAMPVTKLGKKNPPTPHTFPNSTFISKKLDITCGPDGVEDEFYNCILPEDILVELLSERMKVGSFS